MVPDAPKPLPSIVGNMYVPVWALRPGSYRALADVAGDLDLWLALHSWNADFYKPCYASRETLGATIGIARSAVSRRLKRLRKAGLLWELPRGRDRKTKRRRPPARWALDPFAADVWRPEVETALERIAEQDGQDGRWFQRAVTSLDAFDRHSRGLRNRIAEDMPFEPKNRRKRKKGKGRKASGVQIGTPTRNGPGGEVFTRGVGETPASNGSR